MSAYRVRADTAAGGFATLIVLVPWEICQAAGVHEESATCLAAGLLLAMAFGALLLRRTSMAEKSFSLAFFDEKFRIHGFLLAFALFALAELVLAGVVAYMYFASPQP